MKRFTVLFTLLGVLAFWLAFQAWSDTRAEAKKASIPPVYDSTGAMLEAINPEKAKVTLPLVYDSTGAMLEAINPKDADVRISPVYDATGAMLDAINP